MSQKSTDATSRLCGRPTPLSRGGRARRATTAAAAGLALVLGPAATAGADDAILRADVAGSLPTDPAIGGVLPGGRPWGIDKGTVRVTDDGRLKARIRGLVFVDDLPDAGTNTVPELSASLLCGGAVVATTAPVPFDAEGDARLDTRIAVPKRCEDAAVVFHPLTVTARYIAYSVPGSKG